MVEEAEAAEQRAQRSTAFFQPLVPGMLGVVFDLAAPDEVVGHVDVVDALIAGTGYLFAPVVVALADTACAVGCGMNIPEGASFTTVELKSNFMSSARVGERIQCTARPGHLGRRTQVWDAEVVNEASGRRMALFRCTQMIV